ncbi:hypothetical protein LJC01_00840 [Clostridiaceae bacterium OttesenSCG-928-D20]|nr:hypothetical protein [Clostridiaceae bacterium OttesenSCG-928-D20]
MQNAIEYVSFKLKKGVSASDFLAVSDEFNKEFLQKQKGYISRKILQDGETWADLVLWESAEDHLAAMEVSKTSEAAGKYVSMLNLAAKGSSYHLYSAVKSYGE